MIIDTFASITTMSSCNILSHFYTNQKDV